MFIEKVWHMCSVGVEFNAISTVESTNIASFFVQLYLWACGAGNEFEA